MEEERRMAIFGSLLVLLFRDYVRMIVQFYEMFDAKCWYYPESIDHGDRRAIVKETR
jgi:hypothetical protein